MPHNKRRKVHTSPLMLPVYVLKLIARGLFVPVYVIYVGLLSPFRWN
jgi:hypothetical protein